MKIPLVVQADPRLHAQVRALGGQRLVFFAGLPGTGKSLLVHQLAHLADASGRSIHLLQWDVTRPPFETSPAGRRYPPVDGVTHRVIRKAAGLWARHAIARWSERHPEPPHLLIGETPFAGSRFVELAQRLDDPIEPLLAGPSCRFVIPVPSAEVRRFLEAQRERRAADPLHPREREDAPPHVLRGLWRDLAAVARQMGIAGSDAGRVAGQESASSADGPPPFDPVAYRRVYEAVLRHRNIEIVALDTILPTGKLSVYDFAIAPADLAPSEADVEQFIREVERRYAEPAALEREIARWWDV